MRLTIFALALACFARPATSQPADCQSTPAPTQNMPLSLDLSGLPGVPKGLSGQVYADVPVPPPGGTVCKTVKRDLPVDVLHGQPGDLLRGKGPRDLLGGQVRPRIEIVAPEPEDER
jgi:hypothetical protein